MFNSMNKHLFYRAQRYNITSNNTKKSYSILKKKQEPQGCDSCHVSSACEPTSKTLIVLK